MRIFAAAVAFSLVLSSTSALSWNARGHMTVAAIAWEKMTPQARRRAIELLRLNPDYGTWAQGFPEGERDRIAFMEAATWPDDLRSRICTNSPTCIRDDRYTPADAEADQNIGYRDHRLRRYWHFEDLPFSTDGSPLEQPFRVNAETQINAFSRSLEDTNLSEEAKSFNLTWLLHLVGDVHQPLHATARFTSTDRDGDGGGNGVIVCRPPPAHCEMRDHPDTLHGVWDDAVGTGASPRSARTKGDALLEQAAQTGSFLAGVVARADLDAPPAAWFVESRDLAERYAYVEPIGAGKGPYYPTAAYRAKAGSISEQRILVAGLRLAKLLNSRLQ